MRIWISGRADLCTASRNDSSGWANPAFKFERDANASSLEARKRELVAASAFARMHSL